MKIGLIRATLIMSIALAYGSLSLPAVGQNQSSRVQKVSKELAQSNSTYCVGLGFRKGSAEHAQCVINLNLMPAPAPTQSPKVAPIIVTKAASPASATSTRPTVLSSTQAPETNEAYCARIGFKPGSNEHAQCIVNLGASSVPQPQAVKYVGTAARNKTALPSASPSSVGAKPSLPSNDLLATAKAAYERGDAVEAFRITLAAARDGNPSAQSLVAWHYSEGVGTNLDLEKSIYWLNQAIRNNDPRGYHNLSIAYINGKGVPKDLQKAFDYAQGAVKLGHPRSASLLASIRSITGETTYNCMSYGFRQATPEFAQCLLQMDQANQRAEIARQQAEIARLQLEFEKRRYAEQQLAAAEAQRRADAEKRDADRQRASEALRALSEDLLCPKKTRGFFAEPVAGCGRNKNEPVPPTVNVYVQPRTRPCYATAANPC